MVISVHSSGDSERLAKDRNILSTTRPLICNCDSHIEWGTGNDVSGKWEKTQRLIKEVRELLEAGTKIHRTRLESIQGFLIHVARTY